MGTKPRRANGVLCEDEKQPPRLRDSETGRQAMPGIATKRWARSHDALIRVLVRAKKKPQSLRDSDTGRQAMPGIATKHDGHEATTRSWRAL